VCVHRASCMQCLILRKTAGRFVGRCCLNESRIIERFNHLSCRPIKIAVLSLWGFRHPVRNPRVRCDEGSSLLKEDAGVVIFALRRFPSHFVVLSEVFCKLLCLSQTESVPTSWRATIRTQGGPIVFGVCDQTEVDCGCVFSTRRAVVIG
jgi:hypothetical protein